MVAQRVRIGPPVVGGLAQFFECACRFAAGTFEHDSAAKCLLGVVSISGRVLELPEPNERVPSLLAIAHIEQMARNLQSLWQLSERLVH
jgi:hypothetical protein